ncbi:two-component response regulator [Bartonella clarridgeiae 73]|uniref:Two-component response regulator n=1 Tax=Bartonella clarridgeiae (strain CCUG 45776 / CIP 104772 / 73) TaxID=696125 RepID=E6YJG9_BARC7|nr:response regulator transcription factor [Bartonella clarridgeiae]WCR55759.1 MAG: Two-component transcriptional response regulator LuxR family [Bartonella clarridgeiae]CBI77007.1 two-component response regulator [Bartonella clarridgeiae 73]
MNDHTLLIVEDDNDLRPILVEQLQIHKEFKVLQAKTAEIGITIAQKENVDLAIFGIELPDFDGREAVKKLRSQGFRAPIIMITNCDTDCDTILGLKMGANDYVTKPFRFSVLLARIRVQLRQYEHNEDAIFYIGPYTFKTREKLLIDQQNNEVRLTEKEAAILKYLYETRNQNVNRETLLEHIWGYNANIITHTLETHIYRLRKKIEKDPSNAKILITDNNRYRLNI